VGIPLPFDVTPEEVEGFRERAKAACETIRELIEAGAKVAVSDENSTKAHQIATTEKFIPSKTPAGTVLKLEALLTKYDHEFLEANRRIANLVTNKLLEEIENEDPKIRVKVLELLGKRKGVNLFADHIEVTVKQKPLNEIEQELGTLLERYMGPVTVIDSETEKEIKKLEIDLDAELGPEPEELQIQKIEDSPNAS
jgi:hypothetical protein